MQNQNTERNIQEQIKVRRSDQKSILDKRKYVVQHKIDRKGSLKIFIRNVSRRISPPLSFFSCAFLACIMNFQHEVQRILELRYVQNWNAWFYQGSLLETEEAIFEEITLRLCIAVRVCNAKE